MRIALSTDPLLGRPEKVPRRPRIILPRVPIHVIQRGNNRCACFFADADYEYYLDQLRELAERFQCAIHAYALLTNHVHLLLTPAKMDSASLLTKHLGQPLRATRQSPPWPQRHPLGRAVPLVRYRRRMLPAASLPVYRTESGPRADGDPSTQLSLVELSSQRGGKGVQVARAAPGLSTLGRFRSAAQRSVPRAFS